MSDYLRRGFLLGLGAALAGKEKLEKKLDELVSKNEISQDEAKQMMNEFISKGEAKTAEWTQKQEEERKKALEELGLATKEEIAALETRITELEMKLNQDD
jgi:polyhydroxyalkanoate synthesis regulator phasin